MRRPGDGRRRRRVVGRLGHRQPPGDRPGDGRRCPRRRPGREVGEERRAVGGDSGRPGRVFPAPPAPTRVTSGWWAMASTDRASSRVRPMNDVGMVRERRPTRSSMNTACSIGLSTGRRPPRRGDHGERPSIGYPELARAMTRGSRPSGPRCRGGSRFGVGQVLAERGVRTWRPRDRRRRQGSRWTPTIVPGTPGATRGSATDPTVPWCHPWWPRMPPRMSSSAAGRTIDAAKQEPPPCIPPEFPRHTSSTTATAPSGPPPRAPVPHGSRAPKARRSLVGPIRPRSIRPSRGDGSPAGPAADDPPLRLLSPPPVPGRRTTRTLGGVRAGRAAQLGAQQR